MLGCSPGLLVRFAIQLRYRQVSKYHGPFRDLTAQSLSKIPNREIDQVGHLIATEVRQTRLVRSNIRYHRSMRIFDFVLLLGEI